MTEKDDNGPPGPDAPPEPPGRSGPPVEWTEEESELLRRLRSEKSEDETHLVRRLVLGILGRVRERVGSE